MCCSFPPYFDHDAFLHHTIHVLDASVCYNFWLTSICNSVTTSCSPIPLRLSPLHWHKWHTQPLSCDGLNQQILSKWETCFSTRYDFYLLGRTSKMLQSLQSQAKLQVLQHLEDNDRTLSVFGAIFIDPLYVQKFNVKLPSSALMTDINGIDRWNRPTLTLVAIEVKRVELLISQKYFEKLFSNR